MRLRVYVAAQRERVTDDPRADRVVLEGYDLDAEGRPSLEARYVHYRSAHLRLADAARLVDLPGPLERALEAALARAGRWYARFVGLPASGRGRSLYLTLGPRVPRFHDDGP